MNRRLQVALTTIFAFCSTLSCSEHSASNITGIALNDSTVAEVRIASAAVTLGQSPIEVGQTTQATALLLDYQRRPVLLNPIWSSSDTSVATVSGSGVVLARSAGAANIAATLGGRSGAARLAVTAVGKPGTVANLQASAIGSTNLTLSFTQVNDGTGQPAKYEIRYAVAPISWGSATAATSGTCTPPVVVTAIGSQLSCTVLGLTPATNYNLQLIAYRGTLNQDAVFGDLSNIVSGATTSSTPPPPVPVATVSVSPATSSIQIGATVQLLVTARDANDSVLTGRVVTSSSADPAVATVNSMGLVTGVSAGTTQVTVTSEGKSAIATITVTASAPVPVATVSVSPTSSSLLIGATVQLVVTARDANGNVLTGRTVTSSSANPAVATVNTMGLVTAVSAGTTQVTVTSESKSAIATITVTASPPVPVATVTVSPTSSSLLVGATTQLSATTRDAGNNVLTGRLVTWTSANTAIARVSSSGLVTAVTAGNVAITATSEGKTASSAITVTVPAPVPVATVSVSPASASVLVGVSTQFSATTRDAGNNVLTGRVVTWSSSNAGVASVNSSSGMVMAVAAGTATITATSEAKTGMGSITVTVPPPPPPPGSSAEPSGMTLIDQRPFNSLNESASPHNPAWDTDNTLSIVQDPTAPKSPSGVLRNTFPTGFTGGGSAGGHAGVPFGGNYRVLYISYWAKYSSNWYGHETGINKHVYAWAGDYPPFVMEADGAGTETLRPRPALQRMIKGDGMYTNNLVPNAVIPRGAWFHIEIVLTGNTSGTANGSMDWWLDGVHIGSVSGLQYTSGTTAWNVFEMYPVWGGVGTKTVPATQTLDWDHVYLSGKK